MKKSQSKYILVIIAIFCVLYGVYYAYNYKFTITGVRSSMKLYDPNNEKPEQQELYRNKGYFQNGFEQGSVDAMCNSWICVFNLEEGVMRGSVTRPAHSIKINGHRLSLESKKYYNSGYIKGYDGVCKKYRGDCEVKSSKMLEDYKKYYGDNVIEVNE